MIRAGGHVSSGARQQNSEHTVMEANFVEREMPGGLVTTYGFPMLSRAASSWLA